jgi:hypothetical protein
MIVTAKTVGFALAGVTAAAITAFGLAAGDEPVASPRRAKPPVWTTEDLDAFFPDVRDQLVGVRPTSAGANAPIIARGAAAGPRDSRFAWSHIVDADTLATEVKRIASQLSRPLASLDAFKSQGHAECRTRFALLAVLFAVIDQYDGEVRWQSDAAAWRDAFAAAARSCERGSEQSFAEASKLRIELQDIVRGGRPGGEKHPGLRAWSDLADRKLLMQRMQQAMIERVNPQLSDRRTFEKARLDVRHEAELAALLAKVIDRDGYEYWDDDTFRDYAGELRAAAGELSRAASDANYAAARRAAARVGQACAACHDGYRG